MELLLPLFALALAWRNLRTGRGDRTGAFRIAMVVLAGHVLVALSHAGGHFDVLKQPQLLASPCAGRSRRLVRRYGRGRWRKRKGVGRVRLSSGIMLVAELHGYEAHGIGRREMKIKRLLDWPL